MKNILKYDPAVSVYPELLTVQENLTRFLANGGILTDENILNIIAVNVVLAHKALDDAPFDNAAYSQLVFKVDQNPNEIKAVPDSWVGTLERHFLNAIQHNLYIGLTHPSASEGHEIFTGLAPSPTRDKVVQTVKTFPINHIDILREHLNRIQAEVQRKPSPDRIFSTEIWKIKSVEAIFLNEVISKFKQDGPLSFTEYLAQKVKDKRFQSCTEETQMLIKNMLPPESKAEKRNVLVPKAGKYPTKKG